MKFRNGSTHTRIHNPDQAKKIDPQYRGTNLDSKMIWMVADLIELNSDPVSKGVFC